MPYRISASHSHKHTICRLPTTATWSSYRKVYTLATLVLVLTLVLVFIPHIDSSPIYPPSVHRMSSHLIETPPPSPKSDSSKLPPTIEPRVPSKYDPNIPAMFSWAQLKTIIANGHLQLLARHPADLAAYFAWMDIIKEIYGSVQNFVIQERLKWPQTQFEPGHSPGELLTMDINDALKLDEHMVPKREGEGWFKARSGKLHCKILENDWPYSVQSDTTHFVVWSKVPILHPLLIPKHIPISVRRKAWNNIRTHGLYGLLGGQLSTISSKKIIKKKDAIEQGMLLLTPPSSRDDDDMTASFSSATSLEDKQIDSHVEWVLKEARNELETFIKVHWPEEEYETLYFANPPVLQSVPALPHFHVLARKKGISK